MINFKNIELTDKPWMDRLIRQSDLRNAGFNFTNMFVWGPTFSPQVAELNGRMAIKLGYGNAPIYSYPVGGGDLKEAVNELKKDAAERGIYMCIQGITKEVLPEFEALFGGEYALKEERNFFDYVYRVETLASLAGKKLHAKRNHIHRFEEQNDWSFEPITLDNLPECIAMNEKWMAENEQEKQMDYSAEEKALALVFSNFEALGLEGGLLRSSGEVIAYTIGEVLNSDTYVTHFEKAFSHIQGAYPMINREFAKQIMATHPEIHYVNREEDMGLENLRKAKLSYYPEFLVEKYVAIWS